MADAAQSWAALPPTTQRMAGSRARIVAPRRAARRYERFGATHILNRHSPKLEDTAPRGGEGRVAPGQLYPTASNMLDHGGSPDHQHAAQSFIAGSRDNAEPNLTCGRMILRRQADPGRELASRSE